MFVGCLATLRPLFRKMFRLGSLGASSGGLTSGLSKNANHGRSGASPFPTNSRRTYGQVSVTGDFEMMAGNGGGADPYGFDSKGGGGHYHEASAAGARASASISSESDSIEQILKEASRQGLGNKSIVVSRQVQIAHSKS